MKSYQKLLLTALFVLVTDQLSKHWILNNLPLGTYWKDSVPPPITVIPDFFYIVHIQNKGAAWGMFAGQGLILGLLGIVALIAIAYFRKTLELHKTSMQFAFGMLTGGIIGNMIDRFRFNQVVDFLDFQFPFYRYPAFNVADCGITIGVFIYFVYSFRASRKEKLASAEE